MMSKQKKEFLLSRKLRTLREKLKTFRSNLTKRIKTYKQRKINAYRQKKLNAEIKSISQKIQKNYNQRRLAEELAYRPTSTMKTSRLKTLQTRLRKLLTRKVKPQGLGMTARGNIIIPNKPVIQFFNQY